MMKKNNRLVFFGNERLVSGLPHTDTPLLKGLIEAGYNITAVVASHSDGTSRNARTLEVADIAKKHSIPLLLPAHPLDIYDELVNMEADVAILAAYGRIIPQKIIDIFPHGIINLHPSLLPKYRGSTPIETAILNGDAETGVSIMQLSSKMDAGPIFKQQTVSVPEHCTKFELYDILAMKGAELLLDSLPAILDGSLQPTPQFEEQATYTQLFTKADGLLSPETLTAQDADCQVRAHLGFPQSRLRLGSLDVIVVTAHTSDDPTELSVKCKDGRYLAIDMLKPAGKKEMPVKAFLAGYKNKL